MKKLDVEAIPLESGCNYPSPFDAPCLGATWRRLGRAAGLKAFGVNLSRIPPGVWSSQRHWHSHEDEFVMVLEGELALVTDNGEETLGPGDCAAFKAGEPDGHHLVNRSDRDAVVLEIGNADPQHDRCVYSDIDMVAEPGVEPYLHRDGTPYPLNGG
ncbi:MAG: cupin domain-containing protein [Caulobacteraceae bacterium]|nr:cupin domain-containing protein [Caulobacteraceae bacterium]